MPSFDVQVRSYPRADIPADLGVERWLVDRVCGAVRAGTEPGAPDAGAPPVAIAVRQRQVDILDLPRAMPAGEFLAGLTTSFTDEGGPVEAVGVMGRHTHPRPSGAVPVALVFLEWTDCRWWMWEAVLGAPAQLAPADGLVRSALDGDALPDGLGRWWSAARREGLRVGMTRRGPPTDTVAVH